MNAGRRDDTGLAAPGPALWTGVDEYLANHLVQPDAALDGALRAIAAAGLPAISVSPNQGKLLYLVARMIGALRILEIGTLGGYSTIWLARAVGDAGRVVTLEADRKHAEVARTTLARAGLNHTVDLRLGLALDTLPRLAAEPAGPFDLTFVDADKINTSAYFEWALKLSREGSVIVVDNVVRDGAIVDPATRDASVQAMRKFFAALAADRRVEATAIQTVGSKGYDGFAIARVVSAGAGK
jgi:predicted O-methyltransferase YrrM